MVEKDRKTVIQKGQEFCDLAVAQSDKGIYSKALEYFAIAEDCFMQVGDLRWLNFLRHEKLQALRDAGKPEEAYVLSHIVTDYYQSIQDHKSLALIATHQANILMDMERFHEALSRLKIAENIAQYKREKNSLAYIYSTMATSFFELENFVSAMDCIKKAMESYSPETNPYELAWCHYYMGLCYKALRIGQEAETLFEKSYKAYMHLQDYQAAISSMEALRKWYSETGQRDKEERMYKAILKVGQLSES